jgi:hypothetical protein
MLTVSKGGKDRQVTSAHIPTRFWISEVISSHRRRSNLCQGGISARIQKMNDRNGDFEDTHIGGDEFLT